MCVWFVVLILPLTARLINVSIYVKINDVASMTFERVIVVWHYADPPP